MLGVVELHCLTQAWRLAAHWPLDLVLQGGLKAGLAAHWPLDLVLQGGLLAGLAAHWPLDLVLQGGLQASVAADRAALLRPAGGGGSQAQAVGHPHRSSAERAGLLVIRLLWSHVWCIMYVMDVGCHGYGMARAVFGASRCRDILANAGVKVWLRLHLRFWMIFSLFVPTLIKGLLKNKYLQINEFFSNKEGGRLLNKI